jgi:hypothetical protein
MRLLGVVGVFRADRASPPRLASGAHAICAGRGFEMSGAGGDVITDA